MSKGTKNLSCKKRPGPVMNGARQVFEIFEYLFPPEIYGEPIVEAKNSSTY